MIAGNAVAVQAALIVASYLYYRHRTRPAARWPWRSITIIAVTALITGLQFLVPEVLPALRRDLDGLRAGQWWRLVTPMFVQPDGIGQVLSNALFLLMFLPLAEKLYGRGVLVLYFTAGILVQIERYTWEPSGGGSSGAAFGVMEACSCTCSAPPKRCRSRSSCSVSLASARVSSCAWRAMVTARGS